MVSLTWSRHGRDHLRVCGADKRLKVGVDFWKGSSPRVRSRRQHAHRRTGHRGIISACAEQTDVFRVGNHLYRDHLRVCGADIEVSLRKSLL